MLIVWVWESENLWICWFDDWKSNYLHGKVVLIMIVVSSYIIVLYTMSCALWSVRFLLMCVLYTGHQFLLEWLAVGGLRPRVLSTLLESHSLRNTMIVVQWNWQKVVWVMALIWFRSVLLCFLYDLTSVCLSTNNCVRKKATSVYKREYYHLNVQCGWCVVVFWIVSWWTCSLYF